MFTKITKLLVTLLVTLLLTYGFIICPYGIGLLVLEICPFLEFNNVTTSGYIWGIGFFFVLGVLWTVFMIYCMHKILWSNYV